MVDLRKTGHNCIDFYMQVYTLQCVKKIEIVAAVSIEIETSNMNECNVQNNVTNWIDTKTNCMAGH